MQVLETGQEIMELDQSGFCTDAPTVYTGNIGNGKFIVQVSPTAVWLLKGSKCYWSLSLNTTHFHLLPLQLNASSTFLLILARQLSSARWLIPIFFCFVKMDKWFT
jgi:hypothetical protein